MENQTQNMIPVALKKGVLPSGAYPALTQWMSDTLGTVVVLSNLLVVLAQLFAISAPLRMRWLFIAALAYDVLHIGIYLVSGLLFWPWIWNNG